jgi:DNA-binding helix-hairpin-helix protein with protein kinase domain
MTVVKFERRPCSEGETMSEHTLTLTLPATIYQMLKDRAEGSKRTVEDEIKEILVTAVPEAAELSADLQEAISSLSAMRDDELWRAARSQLTLEDAAELEALHDKQREREELSEAERQRLTALMYQYERSMLTRAQAAALLRQRGHDISSLVATS